MKDINNYIVEKLKIDKNTVSKEPVNIEDIKDRDSALAYIESNFDTKTLKSWDPKGKAIKIIYNDKLSMRIDFINRDEYLYTIYGPDEEEIYDCVSTREAYRTNWDEFLNIRKHAASLKAKKANFGRNKAFVDRCHRVADKIYSLL